MASTAFNIPRDQNFEDFLSFAITRGIAFFLIRSWLFVFRDILHNDTPKFFSKLQTGTVTQKLTWALILTVGWYIVIRITINVINHLKQIYADKYPNVDDYNEQIEGHVSLTSGTYDDDIDAEL